MNIHNNDESLPGILTICKIIFMIHYMEKLELLYLHDIVISTQKNNNNKSY